MGRGGKAVQVSGSHGRLTEARTMKKGKGKKFRGTRRVRGPRVTRATAGYPERDSSWYILNCHNPLQHPDCHNESEFIKQAMSHYADALFPMDLSSFVPLVDAEASDKQCRIATQSSLSRRKPIRDAPDFWEPRRESAVGLTSQSDSVVGTYLAPRLGQTDTCVAQGNPSYT
jgi:hypothetical protein